jgi:hypothetical protein
MKNSRLKRLFNIFLTLNNFAICQEINIKNPLITEKPINPKKEWLVLIYIAANNDLYPYASRNIKEASRNAPQNSYVIIQTAEPGSKKTKRFLIDKNKAICLNSETEKFDSGAVETLVDFVTWSAKHYPSEHILLDFWDHGTGCLDPDYRRGINPAELFKFNPKTMMLELDRSRSYLSLFEESRGVCFDETYGTYLTNQKIDEALSAICSILKKKIDIIGFDACLMSMIETAELIKNYAEYMVASQEVELGAGWRYDLVLNILKNKSTEPEVFAKHITEVYQKAYSQITNDYTLSSLNLKQASNLTLEINQFAKKLTKCTLSMPKSIINKQLRNIKSSCCFDEPSFVDIKSFTLKTAYLIKELATKEDEKTQKQAEKLLICAKKISLALEKLIISNKTGPNMNYANGISIYLPERTIHNSYKKQFYFSTNWGRFIEKYIAE